MGTARLENPLSFGSLPDFLAAVLDVVTIMLMPVVVFFIILAGFYYVTARGNPTAIARASRALLYGVIGGVVIAGAEAIKLIVQSVVAGFGAGV